MPLLFTKEKEQMIELGYYLQLLYNVLTREECWGHELWVNDIY